MLEINPGGAEWDHRLAMGHGCLRAAPAAGCQCSLQIRPATITKPPMTELEPAEETTVMTPMAAEREAP